MLTRSFFRPPTFRAYQSNGPLARLQDEANRFFSGTRARSAGFPAVNAWSNGDEVVVTAQLPGFKAEDVEVALEKDMLTLKGERQDYQVQEGETVHRQERWNGAFERTLQLPFNVEEKKIKAEFSNGVLSVTLPKAEISKPKKITVKTA